MPSFAEAGLPGVTTAHYWITVFAPGGTPRPIVDLLNAEIRRIAKSPEYRPLVERQGLVPSDLTPTELSERVRTGLAYWQSIVKPLGIKAD